MMPLIALAAAYLMGGIPFGFLLVKWKTGADVRSSGSGNIGATNVLRTTGPATGALTLALDIAKGFFAVWLAARLTGGDVLWTSAAAVAVMLGHVFPVFLKFKGGKAVASFIGAYLYLATGPLIAALLVWAGVVLLTRYVSLGSILAAGTFPLAVWLILHPPLPLLVAAIVSGAMVVIRHEDNIRRLREGSEHALSFGRRKK
jgi:acyl phosphate:glycerol-3-phosphate acyltransferase